MYNTVDDVMKPTEVFDAILNTNNSSTSVYALENQLVLLNVLLFLLIPLN